VNKASNVSPIDREYGYEMHQTDGEVLLIDRRTWSLAFPISIFTGLVIVLFCLGLVRLFMAPSVDRPLTTWALPLGAGIALLLVLIPFWRTYTHRRDLPTEEIADALIVDSNACVLRRRDGDVLAQLDTVDVLARRDWWWTRGLMQLVILTWPGGRRVVFRTASGRRTREVKELLQGIVTRKSSRGP
jgi:hypothetical protein